MKKLIMRRKTMINHKVHAQTNEHGFFVMELTDGKFAGIKFTLGEVKFAEEENSDGSIDMSFEYEFEDKSISLSAEDVVEFKSIIGNLVLQLLEDHVKNNSVVYKGGTDENKAESNSD